MMDKKQEKKFKKRLKSFSKTQLKERVEFLVDRLERITRRKEIIEEILKSK